MSLHAAIGIGSNLASKWGGRRETILHATRAVASLDGVRLLQSSDLVETEPVGGPEQGPFLNGALLLEVTDELEPSALLAELHAIERDHGRVRPDPVRWGPRTLDLDLLIFGDLVRTEGAPILPHPRMHERTFVLEPLASIAPDLVHPVTGRSMSELLGELIENPQRTNT